MDVIRLLPKTAETISRKARENRLTAGGLQDACPWLCRQIVRDTETRGLFDLWGSSSNLDELANLSIVEPAVIRAIGELADVTMDGPIVHAGLQHTYGYLLSTIVTPYGYKRDRWVSPQLEQGFGLPTDVLGPAPSEGTLLANATQLAGSIAFRGDVNATKQLRRIARSAATVVRKLDASLFEQTRIIESLSLRDAAGRFRSVHIRTDLVKFPIEMEDRAENCLLVYSVQDSSLTGPQLITLFPVTSAAAVELTHPDRFGPAVEIRSRFNSYVPGVTGKILIGRRTLQFFR